MKANAPEKIYVDVQDNFDDSFLYGFTKKSGDEDIEYTCTDAFIDKLECWMNENFYQYAGEFDEGILGPFDKIEDAIENFRNYMKGSKI